MSGNVVGELFDDIRSSAGDCRGLSLHAACRSVKGRNAKMSKQTLEVTENMSSELTSAQKFTSWDTKFV